MTPFFVYMLRCSDGKYYVGHTDDLDTRIAQHQNGTFGGFTSERRPVTLVWSDAVPSREQAVVNELRIKRWSRAKKGGADPRRLGGAEEARSGPEPRGSLDSARA
ncbi:MAG TPA: GIY-YIG nuclease family protein [Anaeromyxobacteraceae bacterium]|nr:GIY-YIG nuclease family protein [Anaeromyxobacteraceae bacterium]